MNNTTRMNQRSFHHEGWINIFLLWKNSMGWQNPTSRAYKSFINKWRLLIASTQEDCWMLPFELKWLSVVSNLPLFTTIHTLFKLKHLSIATSITFNNVFLATPICQGFIVCSHQFQVLMFLCALWALKQQASSLPIASL
jgi:hypothetical protein